jgi:hypothetical protein
MSEACPGELSYVGLAERRGAPRRRIRVQLGQRRRTDPSHVLPVSASGSPLASLCMAVTAAGVSGGHLRQPAGAGSGRRPGGGLRQLASEGALAGEAAQRRGYGFGRGAEGQTPSPHATEETPARATATM